MSAYVTQWPTNLTKVHKNDTWHYFAQKYLPSCILKCQHITLAIGMLNNIFFLHTKMQNYKLKYPNVLS